MDDPHTVVTRGTTFDNKRNLSPSFLAMMEKNYGQTRLGAQELYAELLTDNEHALWKRSMIHYHMPPNNEWRRLVIAIDPATTHHEKSDETGIVVAGLHDSGHVYVLEDLSGRWSPSEWGEKVTEAYWRYKADRVVAEINKGGDLVERVVKSIDQHVAFKAVRATRGKIVRAEPVAALYEKGRIFHIRPFSALEHQLCSYQPEVTSKSPDRMDALVWAVTDLLLAQEASMNVKVWDI
jgi:predicted phage terminase large subunit-like protein